MDFYYTTAVYKIYLKVRFKSLDVFTRHSKAAEFCWKATQ